MISPENFRKWALSFPETTAEAHFEKISFRVRKKIFATYDATHKRASMKLSEVDQSVFCSYDPTVIYPVANKWGKQGWTLIEMTQIPETLFLDVLTTAYCEVAPKKLAALVRPDED